MPGLFLSFIFSFLFAEIASAKPCWGIFNAPISLSQSFNDPISKAFLSYAEGDIKVVTLHANELGAVENSIDGIYAPDLFQYLDPAAVEAHATFMFRALKPGGKAFVVVATPYFLNARRAGFIAEFLSRKVHGDKWPGFTQGVDRFYPQLNGSTPKFINFFDEQVLSRVFEKAGFEIEVVSTFARPDLPKDSQLDGREGVGIIVKKP